MTVYIQFTTVGSDAGPFNLYGNGDGYSNAFAVGVTSAQLLAGFSTTAPDGTTIIRAKSAGVCTNYLDVPVVPLPVTTTTTVTTAPPIPTCPGQVLVFQICNSNSVTDDNFDIILNGTSIGIIDLSASAQVGGLFIGSTNPAYAVTAADFACPLNQMVTNRFNPNLLHYGLNNIHMQNVQNNNSGNYGTIGFRSYTLSGNNLINPCFITDLTYSGSSGESFDLSFTYTECCS